MREPSGLGRRLGGLTPRRAVSTRVLKGALPPSPEATPPRYFRRERAVVLLLLALAGCGEPLKEFPRLGDVEVAEESGAAVVEAPSEGAPALLDRIEEDGAVEREVAPSGERSLLARLFGGRPAPEAPEEVDEDLPEEAETLESDGGAEAAPEQVTEGGFLARLFRGGSGEASEQTGAVRIDPADLERPGAIERRLSGQEPVAVSAERPEQGALRKICGLSRREMGTKIGVSGGFTLYDSVPNATAVRPHAITGFRDGCPRQFDAALAFISDTGRHEVARYDRMNRGIEWTQVDAEYERIKTRVCRVSERAPCGDRITRLGRSTAMVTAYPVFGTNTRWTEILLHGRQVVAVAGKSR